MFDGRTDFEHVYELQERSGRLVEEEKSKSKWLPHISLERRRHFESTLKMMKFALAFLLAGTAAAFTPAAPSKGSTALNVARTKKVTGEVRSEEHAILLLDTVW